MAKTTHAGQAVVLPSEIELAQVSDHHATLLAKCQSAGPENPVTLDLSAGLASAPALQLLIAARKLLETRSAFAGYGPNVGPLLDQPTLTE